ncbi:MAG: hypothetical protein ABSF28_07250 [Terracidiphilus sp.]|jgi:hypothetical protein
MKPTEQTKRHVIARYVEPARSKGEKTIQVRVGNVQKELGWTNRTPSVFSTLMSKEFQQEAGVALIERIGGPRSGGPSTTWQFVYRLLEDGGRDEQSEKAEPKKAGLLALYGICSEGFAALGGGEEFLRRERNWGADAWDRYEAEKRTRENPEAAE